MVEPSPFEILARPLGEDPNFYRQDPVLQGLLSRLLADGALEWIAPQLLRMGALAAGPLDALARQADRKPPEHWPFDRFGNRVDAIEYHPAYREMERIAYGSGMIGLKYDPEVRRRFPGAGQTLGFALSFLFAQAESGLYCPVCMTDGAARVIEKLGSPEQRERLVPRLAATDPDRLLRGAMFLTEKQAGSDVGNLATRAVPDGERFRLHGEKWFCSNVDAEVILTLARPSGAAPGTRGLGLFLVMRDLPGGRRNAFRIERLKEKLGVRSMATGEVVLEGAEAERVGPIDDGFKGMAEMINLSRLYNAFASVAIARRAIYESTRYLRARQVFGAPGIAHALNRELLADLNAEEIAAKHLVFRVAALLDRADAGSAVDGRRVRALTPLAKLSTAKLSVWAASEGIELHGGNGYIEDFPMPRLLRDAQVLPVWEGTTNILVLDVLRACRKEDADRILSEDVRAQAERAPASLREEARALGALARELPARFDELAALSPEGQARKARRFAEDLSVACAGGLLLDGARVGGPTAEILAAAARRLVQRHRTPGSELSAREVAALVDATVP
jgi:acyl-CoA dehydrogenase